MHFEFRKENSAANSTTEENAREATATSCVDARLGPRIKSRQDITSAAEAADPRRQFVETCE
jgi:hypothetical protein